MKEPPVSLTDRPPQTSRIERLERKIHTLQRTVLEKAVLQGQMPMRARLMAHRSRQPEARDRLRRFSESAPAYERALSDAEALPGYLRALELDSLTWWVPLLHPDDAGLTERACAHQNFPYRALTQTRELALGGLMIDVGANLGRMSIPRVVLGDVTAAYCAEPDPLNYLCLARNVRDNHLAGLVLPANVAIDAANGTVRLMRSRTAGGHRVLEPAAATRHEVIEVPAMTLDTWVERAGIDLGQLTFVKVDAQGSEVNVLRGAERVLACQQAVWQIEIDPVLLRRRRFRADDLYQPLRRHFSHFIDLNREAAGDRVRPIADLSDALAYVWEERRSRTDVLVFTLET